MHHLCCLQCCLPSGIMGIVELESSAPESLAEAEDASLCCLRISSSRVRRLTYVTDAVSVGTLLKLFWGTEVGTYHSLLLFLDLLVKFSGCEWLWVARWTRAGSQRRWVCRRVCRTASCPKAWRREGSSRGSTGVDSILVRGQDIEGRVRGRRRSRAWARAWAGGWWWRHLLR